MSHCLLGLDLLPVRSYQLKRYGLTLLCLQTLLQKVSKQNKEQENPKEKNIFKIIVRILAKRDGGPLNCVVNFLQPNKYFSN